MGYFTKGKETFRLTKTFQYQRQKPHWIIGLIPISVRNDTYQDKPENPFPLDGGRLGWG